LKPLSALDGNGSPIWNRSPAGIAPSARSFLKTW
jgi:hypothetical protein